MTDNQIKIAEADIKKYISNYFFVKQEYISVSIIRVGCQTIVADWSIGELSQTQLKEYTVEMVNKYANNLLNEKKE